MSFTSCLSNNDIQTPDQISVPCTTPYFHKDTLTPPSSSRSPPLEGRWPGTYVARDASLYNAHASTSRSTPRSVKSYIWYPSQDMKRTFVCASSHIKHYVQTFIRLPWDARSRPYVCLYCAKKLLNKLQKCTGTRTKNIFLMNKK